MSFKTLIYSVENRILTLTLNRPEQMNAYNEDLGWDLIKAFEQASEDDDVHAVVVTGAGRAFCAGADLSVEGNVFGIDHSLEPTLDDVRNRITDPDVIKGIRDKGGLVTLAIYECKKPVIGAINGAAVGIGATMASAMDIRLVSEHAKVGFVFNKIGIVPEACSSWFLPRVVGISRALEWCYSGDIISPDELLESGFARKICSADTLLEEAYKMAAKFVNKSQVSIAITRQMIYRNSAQDHPIEAHKIDSLAMFYSSKTSGQEGIASFLEKRAPDFKEKSSTDMPSFYPWWEK
jgi:enoyl-CoA hydratase/carnithine racemase